MSAPYTSFLVCFHPGHTDLYVDGLPLAIINETGVHLSSTNPLKLAGHAVLDEVAISTALQQALAKVASARISPASQ